MRARTRRTRREEHAHPEDGGPGSAGLRLQARSQGSGAPARRCCIQVLRSVSGPRRGPRVVGGFSYGAGKGSGESERGGDKRQRGPRARATEAPASAPGPRGPAGGALKQPGVPTGGALWTGQVSVQPSTPVPRHVTCCEAKKEASCPSVRVRADARGGGPRLAKNSPDFLRPQGKALEPLQTLRPSSSAVLE